ncbi:MAG: hypothetical protein KKH74_06490 [Gammaproteobacteria bacterium]|nr:hypothetical protein [Gammaproteobacteria bacterium]MBU1732291.1 hypothetical protein [Gammaproteobacteria bacterium]MBU1893861.1 hypothetical protein [Gammaproteobacteria bacterium]
MLTDDHLEALADKLVGKLKEHHHTLWLDPETHSTQHEFIQVLITEREDRIARRRALEDKIAGSVILSAIMGLIYIIGSGAMEYLREHLK